MVKIPAEQCAIAGANIRAFRQRRGWSQAELGELMGWPSPSTVCAAEGRRGGRQRRFTAAEIDRLAAIFGISAGRLMARCVTCGGCPPAGFACLACGATPGTGQLAAAINGYPARPGSAAVCR